MPKGVKGFQTKASGGWNGNNTGAPKKVDRLQYYVPSNRQKYTDKFLDENEESIDRVNKRIIYLAEQENEFCMKLVWNKSLNDPKPEALVDEIENATEEKVKDWLSKLPPELLGQIKSAITDSANNNGEGLMEEEK